MLAPSRHGAIRSRNAEDAGAKGRRALAHLQIAIRLRANV